MPPIGWWLLHVAQAAALAWLLALGLRGAWRLGGHTLYGNLLFLLAMGFWGLLLAELLFAGRQALGAYDGPGGFHDALNILGWSFLTASVVLFVLRFRRAGTRWQLALWTLVPVLGVVAAFRLWISPPGADADAWLRLTYLAMDAIALGAVAAGLDAFRRLGRGALGRLYIFLGAAIVVRTLGDLYWAYLAARGDASLLATAMYPAAASVAVVGMAMHDLQMRREALEPAFGVPWLRAQQRHLMLLAARLQEAAGGYAARTALMAAGAALAPHDWRMTGLTLEADASDEAWDRAVEAAQRIATQMLGDAGRQAVEALGPWRRG